MHTRDKSRLGLLIFTDRPMMSRTSSGTAPAAKREAAIAIVMAGLFFFLLCTAEVFAQAGKNPASVTLGNKKVIEIGWGYKSITPEMRAQAISERLKKLATAPSSPPPFRVESSDRTVDIMAGDEFIGSVFPGDAERAGKTQEELASEWAAALEQSVREYRVQHSWQRVTIRIVTALLALTACVILLLGMRRLMLVLSFRVQERLEGGGQEKAALKRHAGKMLAPAVMPFFRSLRFVLTVAILYGTLQFLLFLFPATRPWAFPLWNWFLVPVRAFAEKVWQSLPSLLFVVIIAWVAAYLIKFCRFFFRQVRDGTITLAGFRPSWAGTTQRLVSIGIVTLAVLVAYPYIPGSNSAAFKGVSIFFGVLVSLGSSGLVSNMIAGIMLTYMDAFEAGDLVKIGPTIGYVRKSGLLTTTVETRKHEWTTIPNSVVIASDVMDFNKASPHGVIVSVKAGIGYDAPWRQVEAMMKAAAARSEGISRHPEPFVLELSLNAFDVTYELNAYLAPGASYFGTIAILCRNVLDQFNEYGVQIMTPAYVMDPATAKVVPRERWHAAPAANEHPEAGTGERAA